MWSRRRLLAAGSGAALAPLLPAQTGRGPAPRPALRVAFLTDSHLPAGGHNDEMRHALDLAQNRHRAGLVIFGGDNVYAAEAGPRESAGAQLENWQRLVGDALRPGVGRASVLGNHDAWGLNVGGHDFELGRRAAMRAFGMPARYYAFERAGWRFIMLDTVHHANTGYSAFVDKEQRAWLERQLENPAPTIVVGHVPCISGAQLVATETVHVGNSARLPHSRVLADARDLTELFRRRPQVKMYLCGHLHMIERLRFRGVEYVNGGAICGGWWKGEYEHFGPHMAIIDLFPNGGCFSRAIPL